MVNNLKKEEFMEYITDVKLINWCIIHLSTNRKIINANYTKNNFELLKQKYPEKWCILKNKTLKYRNKEFTFLEIEYESLYINNISIKTAKRYHPTFRLKLKKYLQQTLNYTFKDILSFFIQNKYNGDPLKFLKKVYPQECNNIINLYGKECKTKREIIYKYLHDIIETPKINNKCLTFLTHQTGYLGYHLFLKLNIPNITEKMILEIIFNNTYNMKGVKYLKDFFPDILRKIKYLYPQIKKINEAVYLYKNEIDNPPQCLACKKKLCKFSCHSVGYHNFCSRKCAKTFHSILTILKNKTDYKNWRKYYHLVWLYTNISYRKYKTIINPKNYIRGRYKNMYQLDHIIPITYGFLNKIDPKYIGHYQNLQILTSLENNQKGGNIRLTKNEIKKHFEIINKIGFNYYEQ